MAETEVRRAEIIVVMALATDLAIGQPLQFAFRSCLLSLRLADVLGCSVEEKRDIYHQALLRYIGCNADTYLLSALFGDETSFRHDFALADFASQSEVAGVVLRSILRSQQGRGWLTVLKAVVSGLATGGSTSTAVLGGHCEVAERIALRLGLGPGIARNLGQLYERWDGRGLPRGLKGEAVSPAVRIVTLAQDAIVLRAAHEPAAAAAIIASRRGKAYDPAVADAYARHCTTLHEGLDGDISADTIVALEPGPVAWLDAGQLDAACQVIADFTNMRMPWLACHSRRVAELAAAAARGLGLPADEVAGIRRAGWVHDLGELSVPVSVWTQATALSAQDQDRVRLHPYYSERLLGIVPALRGLAQLAGQHHERLDGSGYHRNSSASALPLGARILAAAEAYCSWLEPRPYRAALTRKAAAQRLAQEAGFDAAVSAAILKADGHAVHSTPTGQNELTQREIEVLRLLAAGLTLRDLAARLGIAVKTADNHVQSVYAKIGVRTRAGAVLFAVENGYARPG